MSRPVPPKPVPPKPARPKPARHPGQTVGARAGLPDEFRLILSDYPRNSWPDHADFNGLAAFWLERHLAFRAMMAQLQDDAAGLMDGKLAAAAYAARLSRLGSQFLGDLTGHHQIEDDIDFPQLARLEPRIARGFDMLDGDHHARHALIDRFVAGANAALGASAVTQRDRVGRFRDELERISCNQINLIARDTQHSQRLVCLGPALNLIQIEHGSALTGFAKLLDRHLTDEEDLVLPVLLKHRVG